MARRYGQNFPEKAINHGTYLRRGRNGESLTVNDWLHDYAPRRYPDDKILISSRFARQIRVSLVSSFLAFIARLPGYVFPGNQPV